MRPERWCFYLLSNNDTRFVLQVRKTVSNFDTCRSRNLLAIKVLRAVWHWEVSFFDIVGLHRFRWCHSLWVKLLINWLAPNLGTLNIITSSVTWYWSLVLAHILWIWIPTQATVATHSFLIKIGRLLVRWALTTLLRACLLTALRQMLFWASMLRSRVLQGTDVGMQMLNLLLKNWKVLSDITALLGY